MNIDEIRHELEELSLLLASWGEVAEPTHIEREIALSKLSRLYETIKFDSLRSDVAPQVEQKEVQVSEPLEPIVQEEEPSEEIEEPSIYAIDIEGVSIAPTPEEEVDEEVVEEVVEEEVAEEEVAEEIEVEEEVEPTAEPEPQTPGERTTLFDVDPLPRRSSRHRRSVLMSLYDDSEPKQPKQQAPKEEESQVQQVAEEPQSAPITEQEPKGYSVFDTLAGGDELLNQGEPILADTLAAGVETLGDRLAGVVHHTIISDRLSCNSFEDIGINERYLLAHELFGDDPQMCREELAAIGAFESYDDAMIYIAEKFNWRADSQGAKLLLSILEKKFNIS